MKIYSLEDIEPGVKEEKPQKVLYEGDNFTTRIIKLDSEGKIPDCDMSASVIFNIISGSVEIKVNGKTSKLNAGECLITEPATVSMKSEPGAKIMGIQIEKSNK